MEVAVKVRVYILRPENNPSVITDANYRITPHYGRGHGPLLYSERF